jgi:hypothetical protein
VLTHLQPAGRPDRPMSVSGLISNSRLRRWRAFVVAGVGAAVLSLAVAVASSPADS